MTGYLKILTAIVIAVSLSGALPIVSALASAHLDCNGLCCRPAVGSVKHQQHKRLHQQARLRALGCCCRGSLQPCDLKALPREENQTYLGQTQERVKPLSLVQGSSVNTGPGVGPAPAFRPLKRPSPDSSDLYLVNSTLLH